MEESGEDFNLANPNANPNPKCIPNPNPNPNPNQESGEDFNESDAWQSGHEDWKNDSQANVSKCVQVSVWVGGGDITQQCIAC